MSFKITTLRKMDYDKHVIYVLQFGTIFQYLFSDKKGEIYQDHVDLKPSILNRIKYALGMIEVPYTEEEMEFGEELALAGAVKSVDALNGKVEETPSETQSVPSIPKEKGDCMWRAVTLEGGEMGYQCLDHGDIVPLVDGEKPVHEK